MTVDPSRKASRSGATEVEPTPSSALERQGGLMVYDVSDPQAPAFQQYINPRDATADPQVLCERGVPESDACAAIGDLGPDARCTRVRCRRSSQTARAPSLDAIDQLVDPSAAAGFVCCDR